MSFTVHCMGRSKTFDHKISMLEAIGDRDPERKCIAARINNLGVACSDPASYSYDPDLAFAAYTKAAALSAASRKRQSPRKSWRI